MAKAKRTTLICPCCGCELTVLSGETSSDFGAAPARFKRPSLEDVSAYASEKGWARFDAERFWNYYESVGWKVGRKPMKDWKRACVNWNAREEKTHAARARKRTPEEDLYYAMHGHDRA